MLDRLGRGQRGSSKQHLALQRGAVEGSGTKRIEVSVVNTATPVGTVPRGLGAHMLGSLNRS
jgi:hypothetical protein